MTRQLLALLLCTGCGPATPGAGPSSPLPAVLSADVTADSAVFVIPTPPGMWSRVRSIADTSGVGHRALNWHVSWDSSQMVGWTFGCCGIGVTVHVPTPAPSSIDELLPGATRVSFTTRPGGSIDLIVLANEPAIEVNSRQDALIIRLGGSSALAQLVRLRPDSLQVASRLSAADTAFVAWVKPTYRP